MKSGFSAVTILAGVLSLGFAPSFDALAQTNASTTLSAISAMPLASIVVGTSAVAGAVVAVPVALSTAGAVLTVKAVEVSAKGSVYVLERASDGARVSVEVLGKAATTASVVTGTAVAVSIIGAGTVLSVAGEVIAFIPNAVGKSLLHNERVTP
jgi:hypothetical protein